jgi:hypothetical protein
MRTRLGSALLGQDRVDLAAGLVEQLSDSFLLAVVGGVEDLADRAGARDPCPLRALLDLLDLLDHLVAVHPARPTAPNVHISRSSDR